MTKQRSIERLLDNWLADGPNEVNDRVIDVVADRIGRQSQQPAWRISWRDSHVNSYLKPLLAVAAVVVIAVAGIVILGRPSGSDIGGAVSPAPSPSPSPSPEASTAPLASPSASAVYPAWYTGDGEGVGILPAGSQTTRNFRPGFTFTVPEGWVNDNDSAGVYGLFPDTAANQAEFAVSGNLAQNMFMGPLETPYFVCEAWEQNRGTAAEMVASLVANEAIATSEPIDVTIGGLTGKQIDVRLDPGWTEKCPGDPPTLDLGDGRTRAILLDSPDRGVIVIFIASLHSAGHEAFLAEVMPIIESLQFDTSQ